MKGACLGTGVVENDGGGAGLFPGIGETVGGEYNVRHVLLFRPPPVRPGPRPTDTSCFRVYQCISVNDSDFSLINVTMHFLYMPNGQVFFWNLFSSRLTFTQMMGYRFKSCCSHMLPVFVDFLLNSTVNPSQKY